jgi:hypothetical protein
MHPSSARAGLTATVASEMATALKVIGAKELTCTDIGFSLGGEPVR